MKIATLVIGLLLSAACGQSGYFRANPAPPPVPPMRSATIADSLEYVPFLATGTATITGQAFLPAEYGSGVTLAAGRAIFLDPETAFSRDWFNHIAMARDSISLTPGFAPFVRGRRIEIADADGRFTFKGVPAGSYFVSTSVTWWSAQRYGGMVGGPVQATVLAKNGETVAVVVNMRAGVRTRVP